jgi:ferredoxin
MTFGGDDKQAAADRDSDDHAAEQSSVQRDGSSKQVADSSNGSGRSGGFGELGPIALSFAEDQHDRFGSDDEAAQSGEQPRSISSLSTEEWRARYEQGGAVDLWVEEEFNSGSRLTGGRDAHHGGLPGSGSGEGPSRGAVATHTVRIHNPAAGQEVEVEVPEDRYILFEAEEQGLLLPWACRMGCCTACAVKVVEGEVHQPQALGISRGLREQGYALMCTSYPRSDAVLQCVEEDELYDKQFGEAFAAQALDPNDRRNVLRDDFALEIADMDE